MSASTSCSERARAALDLIRGGGMPPPDEVRALGEECPSEFFRILIEALSDSFDPALAAAYDRLMAAFIPPVVKVVPVIPERVDVVYVLSRVTLGSDIKITSAILDAMKARFPLARIVLVGGRKSAELFADDARIEHLEANYPRSGPVSARLLFAAELRERLAGEHRIVVDPDSRFTQLGLIPVCEPEHYFHFLSRTIGGDSDENLSRLTWQWLEETFGQTGRAFIAPKLVEISGEHPIAAVSLGVGENESKRVAGDFETQLIRTLGKRYQTVWVDRGAGGEEAQRVTAAVEASGVADRVKFWEGSFAGFASIIGQSDFYVGYDSAGQHAAAASRTQLITVFAGASSGRFRSRWAADSGLVINADGLSAAEVHARVARRLPRTSDEIDQLREQIKVAFPPRRFLGKATGCTRSHCDECSGLERDLSDKQWDELSPEFIDPSYALSLLLPEAMSYFLPAWMMRSLDVEPGSFVAEYSATSLCVLSNKPEQARWEHERLKTLRSLLTPEQVGVVQNWMFAALSNAENAGSSYDFVEDAVKDFWSLEVTVDSGLNRERNAGRKSSLSEFFSESPLPASGLEIERDEDPGRDIDLGT